MDTNPNVTVRVDGSNLSDAQAAQVVGNVSQALGKLEQASQAGPLQSSALRPDAVLPQSWVSRNTPLVVFVMLSVFLVSSVFWLVPRIGKQFRAVHTAQINRSCQRSDPLLPRCCLAGGGRSVAAARRCRRFYGRRSDYFAIRGIGPARPSERPGRINSSPRESTPRTCAYAPRPSTPSLRSMASP